MRPLAHYNLRKRAFVDPDTGCWLWRGWTNNWGYASTTHEGRRVYAHRLAAHLAHGFDLDDSRLVLHRCDRPSCVNPDHLYVGTASDNARDRWARNRNPVEWARGERNGRARLTAAQVVEIKRDLAAGALQRVVAARFGVGQAAISQIATGRTWAHVREAA